MKWKKKIRRSGQKAAPIVSHVLFKYTIAFMFLVLGPCEPLRRLRKLTMQLELDFSFPFSLSISVSVVHSQMTSLEEETGAGYGVGG
jgi:hypothetical protein